MVKQVTPTGYALLGLLSFGRELSGYELKQWADGSLRFFYSSPPMSQVYAELRRLGDERLVLVRSVGSRETKRYRLSAAGRRRLAQWLSAVPVEAPLLKHHLALRVFLGHLVDTDVLIVQVEAHRRLCDQLLEDLAAVRVGLAGDPVWRNAELVAQWGEIYYKAEAAAAEMVGRQLADRRPGHAAIPQARLKVNKMVK